MVYYYVWNVQEFTDHLEFDSVSLDQLQWTPGHKIKSQTYNWEGIKI